MNKELQDKIDRNYKEFQKIKNNIQHEEEQRLKIDRFFGYFFIVGMILIVILFVLGLILNN